MEREVYAIDLPANEEGSARQQFQAAKAGQYRLSYKVTDAKGHTIEGGYVFTIIGTGFTGDGFRFNNVELIPDQKEYRPGEEVKMRSTPTASGAPCCCSSARRTASTCRPKCSAWKGKSAVERSSVVQKDMPNFFVEAITVAGGNVYTEVKEIVVPPEKRVLNVEVLPSVGDLQARARRRR